MTTPYDQIVLYARRIDGLKQQLAECRKELALLEENSQAVITELQGERDALWKLVQRTLNYHRETDSTRTAKEVIADLVAGLEGKP